VRESAAPDAELLHRREAHKTGREGGSAVGADVIRTAGERKRGSTSEGAEGGVIIIIMWVPSPPADSPHKHSSRSRPTSRRPTFRWEIISEVNYSGYSGRPTPTSLYSGDGRPILWGLAPGS
jgi:hypothetical protein